jgi:hypothetical protein
VQQGVLLVESVHRGREHANILTLEQLTAPAADAGQYPCARCDMFWIRFQQDSILIDSTHKGAAHRNVVSRAELIEAMQASLSERKPEAAIRS